MTNVQKALREDNEDVHRVWPVYREALAVQLGLSEEKVDRQLTSKLKKMVRALLELLPEDQWELPYSSSLMGWDVILDDTFSPWIMETNIKPDLRVNPLSAATSTFRYLFGSLLDLSLRRVMGEPLPDDFCSWSKI